VILGEGRSSPDNNIVVAPSVVTSSATQVEEQCTSGLPAAGPVRTMGRRASSDENIPYNRIKSSPIQGNECRSWFQAWFPFLTKTVGN
jgi:hypothetical protein